MYDTVVVCVVRHGIMQEKFEKIFPKSAEQTEKHLRATHDTTSWRVVLPGRRDFLRHSEPSGGGNADQTPGCGPSCVALARTMPAVGYIREFYYSVQREKIRAPAYEIRHNNFPDTFLPLGELIHSFISFARRPLATTTTPAAAAVVPVRPPPTRHYYNRTTHKLSSIFVSLCYCTTSKCTRR